MSRTCAIAIHGGAGDLARYEGTGRLEEAEQFLSQLIDELHSSVLSGRTATDVVCEAVCRMEDSGLFHAGKGTSPTSKGYAELDASIMEGTLRKAGAVAAARTLKNPIRVARYIMDHTAQVLIVGPEADLLAEPAGCETVQPDYFRPCDEVGAALPSSNTVGAVALDINGYTAAATSTGGTLHKRAGRVGDAPIIGAGTYAVDGVGAISCTGIGEFFLRTSAASRVLSRMDLLGEMPGAASGAILSEIVNLGGAGGMIVVNSRGSVVMPYTTSGMYRASIDASQKKTVGCL